MSIGGFFSALILGISLIQSDAMFASEKNESCQKLIESFLVKAEKDETVKTASKTVLRKTQLEEVRNYLRRRNFSVAEENLVLESLLELENPVKVPDIKNYLEFSLSYTKLTRKYVLLDVNQMGSREITSPYMLKFKKIEEKIDTKKFKTITDRNHYSELYHSCRALTPNSKNANAASSYKNFSMVLGLGTLASGYALYNMDREKDLEWFMRLGYDVAYTVIDSMVGARIQIAHGDSQIVKTFKNYFFGRAMGATDVVVFDPLFSNEREKANGRISRLKEIKEQGELQIEVDELLKTLQSQSLYRKYKQDLILKLKAALKESKSFLSLGVDERITSIPGTVDWNRIMLADLDRPEVQEVLVLAAMNEIYQQNAGDYIVTGDTGIDRYTFNSMFSLIVRVPKNFVQAFWTFNILCMGQDRPHVAFTKAVLMNVTANFAFNQLFYYTREQAINQR